MSQESHLFIFVMLVEHIQYTSHYTAPVAEAMKLLTDYVSAQM